MSEELVAIEGDELQDLHDEAQDAAPPAPVVVPENVPAINVVPAIDAVPENEPENELADNAVLEAENEQENEPTDDAVLEAEPAADDVPQNHPDAHSH